MAVGAVFFRIVEPAPRLAMLARLGWGTAERQCRPSAMMRLEPQAGVSAVCGQLQQPLRECVSEGPLAPL